MSLVTPLQVAKYASEHVDFHRAPTEPADFISEIVRAINPNVTRDELDLHVLANMDSYLQELKMEAARMHRAGRFCPYEVIPSRDIIIGYSCPRPTPPKDKDIRRIAPYHGEVLAAIRNLSPHKFEAFSARVLDLLGSDMSHTTLYTKDSGVDFVGRLRIQTDSTALLTSKDFAGFEDAFSLTVYGQAKAYSNKVGLDVIRELVGSIALLRFSGRGPDGLGSALDRVIPMCEPLLPLVFTTGEFTSQAKRLARETGVVLKDGSQLATFLCLRNIGFRESDTGLEFDRQTFMQWVSNDA